MTTERAFVKPSPAGSSTRSTLLLLGGVFVLGTVFVAALLVVSWWYVGRSGEVKESSFLAIRLDSAISDAPKSTGFVLDPEDQRPLLTEVTAAVRHAATDERIKGIWLQVDDPSLGWAGGQELRDSLVEFRASGKPCVAFAETWTTGGYFVASACDTVAVAPAGILLVNGLAVHVTYYAGMFEKIGVKSDMLHVGDFKSAVEPYERTGPTEPASLAMDQLLDSIYSDFVTPVAESRGLSAEAMRALVDHPSLSPARALQAGLVDVLAYPDQLLADLPAAAADRTAWLASLPELQGLDDEATKKLLTPLSDYVKSLPAPKGGRIAVVFAEGPIMSGGGDGGLFGGSMLGDRDFAEWMDAVREDDEVKALVLRVNSPGGSALASDMMWRDLQRVKAAGKPVVVSMGNYAASGGYYIAAPADWIVAQPNTLTGSIGVFGGKITFAGTYEKLGLSEHVWERGNEADLLSTTELFTEDGRIAYQGFIDDFYETFLKRVSDGRHLDRDAVHEVAQGRVWSGRQALERGLVDELGGLPVAIRKAAELSGVTGDPELVRYPKQKTFFELVMEDLESQSKVELTIPGVDADVVAEVLALERIFDGGPLVMLPGNLTVE